MSFRSFRTLVLAAGRSVVLAPVIRHGLSALSIVLTGQPIAKPCPHSHGGAHALALAMNEPNATDASPSSEKTNSKA